MNEKQEFKVNDRRIDHGAASSPAEADAPQSDSTSTSKPKDPGFTTDSGPSMDFTTFVVSLSQSAFIHMGLVNHPDTGKPEPNLTVARQNIDILSMLEEKTRGNLSDEEGDLLSQMLYTLRMRFVTALKDAEASATTPETGG
ncbi:MAG: DUF1844 domain-containing protein [Nitrospirota bacterium]|nr:DUF1844 domain-containing protein [Nitrospirota bacterium]